MRTTEEINSIIGKPFYRRAMEDTAKTNSNLIAIETIINLISIEKQTKEITKQIENNI